MNVSEIKKYINDNYDIETAEIIPVSKIVMQKELRECCDQNVCGKFNTCWSCPPAIPSFEQCKEKIQSYPDAVLLHQSYELEDEYDYIGMFESNTTFDRMFRKIYFDLKEKQPDIYGLSAGHCTLCEKCTYPDNPCRMPDKMLISMEACGIYVLDLAKKVNVPYRKSPKHVDYYGIIFVK